MKRVLIFLVSLVILTSGCMDSMEEEEIPEEFEDADVQVLVGEMYFQQEGLDEDVIEAEVGDEIVFYSEGDVRHTVTIPELGVDEEIDQGGTVSVDVEEEVNGALVDCTFHENHEAVLNVDA